MASNKRPARKAPGAKKSMHSKTPLTIRYSPSSDAMLKDYPRQSLGVLSDAGSERAWNDVFFRVNIGVELAKLYIAQDVSAEFRGAIAALLAIELRSASASDQERAWSATQDEIASIDAALDITDQIQDTTTRKEQLTIYLATQAMMQKRTREEKKMTIPTAPIAL